MNSPKLRLTGPHRSYDVDFDRRDSNLAIIAGPIHTGKTTILEMIAYLLGDDSHPTHPELAQTVRSAELCFSVAGATWTVERPLFSSEQVAYLRSGTVETRSAARRMIIDPPGDPSALSAWILDAVGIGNPKVKVTESNPNSPAHDLSIRDVMWVTYLPSKRLDNQALLHEGHPQKQYKLRQVVEIIFGVHDDRLAQLLDQLKRLREERREYEREVAAIETFMAEEDVPERDALLRNRGTNRAALEDDRRRLDAVSRAASASTDFASDLRARHSAARVRARAAAARLRDREALVDRLLPLRGQYAEDERKLTFFDEAKRLFDPLHVANCPACLQELRSTPAIEAGRCSLCREELEPVQEVVFAFDRERRALRRRIKDLDAYTEHVQEQVAQAATELRAAEIEVSETAGALDRRTADALSPFVAEREELVRRIGIATATERDLDRAVRWHDALERRRQQVAQTSAKVSETSKVLAELSSDQPDRGRLVSDLSERFGSLLRDWGFPKLDDPEAPFVDEHFIPHVRGRAYGEIGSDGALTLISVAWTLAVFELAVEGGWPHPGVLLLDSPQKNLAPKTASETVDEYMDPAIVRRMYAHIVAWTTSHPDAQVIVVDHEPPDEARDLEVVRFTRRADIGRYGLIDDETG